MLSAAALPFHNRIVYGHTDLPSFDRDTGPVSLPNTPAPPQTHPWGQANGESMEKEKPGGVMVMCLLFFSDGFCFFFLLFSFLV